MLIFVKKMFGPPLNFNTFLDLVVKCSMKYSDYYKTSHISLYLGTKIVVNLLINGKYFFEVSNDG